MLQSFRGLRTERFIVALRLLLAASTACAWLIAVALKPLLSPVTETGFPGQGRAFTLGTTAADVSSIQTGFGSRALSAMIEWTSDRGRFAACGHISSVMSLQDGQRAQVRLVSRDCLKALQAPLTAGRVFSDTEHAIGTTSQVCIASQRIADRSPGQIAIGKAIHGVDRQCTVVGIIAGSVQGFVPDERSDDLWMPLESSPGVAYNQFSDLDTMSMVHLAIVGLGQSAQIPNREEIESVLRRTGALDEQHRLLVESGVSTDIARNREIANLQSSAMLIAMALFIATLGNSALLTESVLASRRHVLAVKTAVGASPIRLLKDVLSESVALASVGATAGIGVGYVLLKFAVDLNARYSGASVSIENLALPATIAVATTGIQLLMATLASAPRYVGIFGPIAPEGLGRSRSSTYMQWMMRIQLFAAALVIMMTVSSATRFFRLLPPDAGMAMENITMVRIRDSQFRLMSDDPRIQPIVQETLERLRSIPGIDSATAASLPPIGIDDEFRKLDFPGLGKPINVRIVRVFDRYARTVGIRVLRGATEDLDKMAPNTAFIDDALLARYQGTPPDTIRFVHTIGASKVQEFRVLGVVRRVIHETTRGPAPSPIWQPSPEDPYRNGEFPTIYLPYDGFADPVFIVRSTLSASEIAKHISDLWKQVSPTGRVNSFTTAKDALESLVSKEKLLGVIFGIGSITLLLIVAAAIFGSIAVTLAIRQRNSAIALALGAPPSRLIGRDLGKSMMASVLASLVALPLAYMALAMTGDAIPMGVEDALMSFGTSVGALLAVTVGAMLPLAVRIANTNPNVLLRV